jgi:hypothetical protein
MGRYFFHLHIGPVYIRDREGDVLPDDVAARERAIHDILVVYRSKVVRQHKPSDCVVVVTDENGEAVFSVPFSDAPGLAN